MNDNILKNEINENKLTQVTGGTAADVQNEFVISLSGILDVNESPAVQKSIEVQLDSTNKLILDMSGVTYINSAGLRMLLTVQMQANRKGCSLIIKNVSPDVMRQLELTGFAQALNIQ
ncbi:MAG: STAS domain-containing protein [Ruminiclostridium sp.]